MEKIKYGIKKSIYEILHVNLNAQFYVYNIKNTLNFFMFIWEFIWE